MLLNVLICWFALAIALATILCRQIHKAKIADQAMGIQHPEDHSGIYLA
ncbi:hypothetical protein HNO86_18740 [Pseudomonas sp. C1C7]|nr:hypothetical protein [Pseudomonas sp. C1C7]NUT77082.1 hypothetical protein [Pseudomonas sp. C1C7]